MYAGESGPSTNQSNAKSYIQALLKSREYKLAAEKFSTDTSALVSTLKNSLDDISDIECTEKDSAFLQSRTALSTDEINSHDYLDNQNDFNYSQKLFHISDGNLYSIFSPIQGRSYGMKPSFLRKQKYTVQECHSRGRKNLRKGLKFHNFLPSESVTSEKDSGVLKAKWKVRSECRLREEHGTKQITISNWSQSAPRQPIRLEKTADSRKAPMFRQNLPSTSTSSNSDPYDFSSSLQSDNYTTENPLNMFSRISKEPYTKSAATKKDSLTSVLNSLLDKSESQKNSYCDEINQSSKLSQKHRRKPVQTRRVVPYVKYLSIMEENDSVPLDLSSKCSSEKSQTESDAKPNYSCNTSTFNGNDSVAKKPTVSLNSSFPTPVNNVFTNNNHFFNVNMLPPQMPTPLMILSPSVNNGTAPSFVESHSKLNLPLNISPIKIKKTFSPSNSGNGYTIVNDVAHKNPVNEPHPRTRRRNQRSVIKQKLEDTFRQNGFLVKTKQVSDGEATFCKFRQLRKYTRYYLKSWQQHLPDEVNKMWKGFLPPKTVLPPVTEAMDPTNQLLP